jgi:hypothetical protein
MVNQSAGVKLRNWQVVQVFGVSQGAYPATLAAWAGVASADLGGSTAVAWCGASAGLAVLAIAGFVRSLGISCLVHGDTLVVRNAWSTRVIAVGTASSIGVTKAGPLGSTLGTPLEVIALRMGSGAVVPSSHPST